MSAQVIPFPTEPAQAPRRVAAREARKATQDLCVFGTAFIWIPPDGQPEYVTISEAYERMEG